MKKIIVILAFCFAFTATQTFAQYTNGTGERIGGSNVVQNHGVWPSKGGYTVSGSQIWYSFTVSCHNAPNIKAPITIWVAGGSSGSAGEKLILDINNAPLFSLNQNSADGPSTFMFNFQFVKNGVPDFYNVSGNGTGFMDGFLFTGLITGDTGNKKTGCGGY